MKIICWSIIQIRQRVFAVLNHIRVENCYYSFVVVFAKSYDAQWRHCCFSQTLDLKFMLINGYYSLLVEFFFSLSLSLPLFLFCSLLESIWLVLFFFWHERISDYGRDKTLLTDWFNNWNQLPCWRAAKHTHLHCRPMDERKITMCQQSHSLFSFYCWP